jgi:hypothetical protein
MSTFKANFGHDGQIIESLLKVPTIGLSMDDAIKLLGVPQPHYIKLDVDGIEHLILSGGVEVLKHTKEILVEVNDDFAEEASRCAQILTHAGFYMKEKRHALEFDNLQTATGSTYNQIWDRLTKI